MVLDCGDDIFEQYLRCECVTMVDDWFVIITIPTVHYNNTRLILSSTHMLTHVKRAYICLFVYICVCMCVSMHVCVCPCIHELRACVCMHVSCHKHTRHLRLCTISSDTSTYTRHIDIPPSVHEYMPPHWTQTEADHPTGICTSTTVYIIRIIHSHICFV